MPGKSIWLFVSLYFTFFGILSGKELAPSKDAFHIIELTPGKIILSLQPFELDVNPVQIDQEAYLMVSVVGFGLSSEEGYPMLPVVGVSVQIPSGAEVSVAVLESSFEEIADINLPPNPEIEDYLTTDNISYSYKKKSVYKRDSFWPTELVEFSARGRWRSRDVGRIQVNPVQYNPLRKILRVYKTLTFEITFSKPFTTRRASQGKQKDFSQHLSSFFLLNGVYESGFEQKISKRIDQGGSWYNSQALYHKLSVVEEGIYALTYNDLVNAGVPADQLDLLTLKILHRGQQIPLWIQGPDGSTFGPENTIYFYGDRHRGSETYFDLYTDTNVYWLTDQGDAGIRYKLQDQSSFQVNPSFYWETFHFEKDNQFHRSNRSGPIDDDEGWIWRYFFEGEQETVDFDVTGLYGTANPSSLRARLHGTTLDPVNPDHHVQFLINDQIVIDAFFDDREEALLEVTFQTTFLQNGQNRLTIQLLTDTGAQINQIYLDWIEVTFPRTHAAVDDEIKFTNSSDLGPESSYFLSNFSNDKIFVFQPSERQLWQPQSQKISFYTVESAGFDDGNFVRFTIDDTSYFFKNRGHNLAIIDAPAGVLEFRHFDTFVSGQQADEMANFINGLPDGTLVLVGISDEGSLSMTEQAHQALESLGSSMTRQVEGRDSWSLIGQKGAPIGSVKEALSKRFEGPAVAVDTLSDEYAFKFSATFTDSTTSDGFYYATSTGGLKKVVEITREDNSDLMNVNQGADYIIITHKNFVDAARLLANYRENRNDFRTAVVDVQDIYDEFNFGIISPHAIKDFLKHVYFNWQPPATSFVVLFGDASWDPKKLLDDATKTDFVPSYGSLVSDNWFVTLDGEDDVLPEMFLGRIPVETPEQAEIVINKIISYESLPFGDWNKELLFLNGGIGSLEQSIFLSQATTLISNHLKPPPFAGKVTNINKTTNEIITQAFIFEAADIINRGILWVNFLGHAGSSIWDINIEGPEVWQNQEIFPFMTGMSCHSARFANPIRNSLSEDYFITPFGASAYWGSAGFGYILQDFFLLDGLFKAVTRDTVRTFGEATTFAKFHLWQQLGEGLLNQYVINQYVLIGDPAMKLAVSEKPELAIRTADISFESQFLLTSDSTTTINVKIRNFGLVPLDSIGILATVLHPDGKVQPILETKIPHLAIVDSLSIRWQIPDEAGLYQVKLEIDPENLIEEVDKLNNVAETEIPVFNSDLTPIKPINFGVESNFSTELVTGNSRALSQNLTYHFEVDTSSQFNSPLFMQSLPIAEGNLVTSWQVALNLQGVYYWRVRTFDGQNFGPWVEQSFLIDPSGKAKWSQSKGDQFALNVLEKINTGSPDAATLSKNQFIFEVESAGFLDGAHAFILKNGALVSLNRRGHNLAVFDQTSVNLLSSRSFDTFVNVANSDSLADYINAWPEGRIIIAAIHDEGSLSMNENAYAALESIGSQFTRQVGVRDSWAIIGTTGAAIASVPEGWSTSGDGPVAFSDTLSRFEKTGKMTSTEIGPALAWNSVNFSFSETRPNEQIEFQIIGRNRISGQIDSLKSGLSGIGQIDISEIKTDIYPTLNLEAVLTSEDGVGTAELNSWSVNFVPPPDLVVGRQSIQIEKDTLFAGEELKLSFEVGNFGLSPSDSFNVRLFANISGEREIELEQIRVPGIAVNNIYHADLALATEGLLGRVILTLIADILEEVPEINESNNRFSTNIWVARDTLSPRIRVTFDGREVGEAEFVSANPQIITEIREEAVLSAKDTSLVSIFLDGNKVKYGVGPGEAQFFTPQNADEDELKAVTIFQPQLSQGDHEIDVVAKDLSGNLQHFQIEFFVSTDFLIADVMNYPNPFRDFTEFTYTLTQPADNVIIKIFTISGRLIHTLDFASSRVGFNKVVWDGRDQDHDALSNGVYLYKIIASRSDEQVEVIEKFVVMR